MEEEKLIKVLKHNKEAIGWNLSDLKGISPSYCMHKILMEDNFKPVAQPQRRLNPTMKEVVRKEVVKLLEAGMIYPISDSSWVSPVQVVPKKGGMTVVKNELIPTRTVTGWRMCIDYRRLNQATRKDHFPLPFMDQMLERLSGQAYYCFLDSYSGYAGFYRRIMKRQLLRVLSESLPTKECHLASEMLQQHFNDVCKPYSLI